MNIMNRNSIIGICLTILGYVILECRDLVETHSPIFILLGITGILILFLAIIIAIRGFIKYRKRVWDIIACCIVLIMSIGYIILILFATLVIRYI